MYAPCNRIKYRGDTLGGPFIIYKISSPLENVIRIRVFHYIGAQDIGPHFEVGEDSKNIYIDENEDFITATYGDLKIKIDKKNFPMEFYNGDKYLTKSSNKSSAYFKENNSKFLDEENIRIYMRDQLGLSVGEMVYGLRERFTPFIKNSQSIDIWNEDGGISTEQSYKNISFYITDKGYGVFVNHPERISFEVGSEQVTKVQFSLPGDVSDYYIIVGRDMKEVLENYTELT